MMASLLLPWLLGTAPAATLDEVLAAAEAYAPVMASADAEADRARADLRRTASLLGPTVQATATYLVNNYEVTFDTDGGTVVIQPLHYGQASASLVQPFTPAALAAQRAASALASAARHDAVAARGALVLNVAHAYHGLLVAQEALVVQRDLLALATEQERLARTRQDVGMAEDRDVLQAQLAVSRARRELQTAEAAHVAAVATLRAFTGREESTPLTWPEPPAVAETVAREEVASAEARLEAANRRVRSAWTLWVPDLAASLTFNWTGNAGFTGRQDLLTGQFGARWEIPVAGAYVHQRAAWAAEARAAEAGLRAVSDVVAQQVATAHAELTRARAAEAAMQDELLLAERHQALTVRAFEVGAATALEVDSAQAQVRAARLGALRERAGVAVAIYTVAWAEGRLGR